jgi:hypothetical protein
MRPRTPEPGERRHPSTRHLRRPALATLAAAALVVPALVLAGPAGALDPAGVGPRDPGQFGFPAYYTDDAGVVLQMCDDGSASCLGANNGSLIPPDGENFYFMATSDVTTANFDISVELAAEAAWLDVNTPITFDRLRIRGHSDVGDITVTTPYGTTTVPADPPTEQRNINVTEDVGCEAAPCDFTEMVTSPAAHITEWITSTTPPPGRIGDGVSLEPATVGGLPATLTVNGVSTDEWVVMGKEADPNAVSLPSSLDFGNARTARVRSVRMLNLGTEALTVSGVTLAGSPTLRLAPAATTCGAGDTLAVGGACRVGVRYTPDGRKRSSATVTIADDTPAGTHAVQVSALAAAVVRARTQMQFDPRRAGTGSRTRRIVVTNTGSLPLQIRRVSLGGRNPGSFEIRRGAPRVCARGTRVPVGQQCGVYVGFEPRGFGPKRASLVLRSNALPVTHTIALSGRAR